MLRLPESLNAWNSTDFESVLKRELEQLGAAQFPLQQALSSTSYALDDMFNVMIVGVSDGQGVIHVKLGVFFFGVTAGCSCADDPTPVEPQSEYCELMVAIDKTTAEAVVTILSE